MLLEIKKIHFKEFKTSGGWNSYLKAPIPDSEPSLICDVPLNEVRASWTAFWMNSSLIRREGCSLNTEFISAILAELRRASALVGQFWKRWYILPTYYISGLNCFKIYIYLKTSEAASARKGYETNVWLAISWNRFVNYKSPVFHFGSAGLLHLPKLLKGFDHINWNTYICLVYACIFGTSHSQITSIISILVKSSYRW